MSFSSLGLIDQISRTLADLGYSTPTPVQTEAIPAVLAGRDVMAAAQTGTGKTAGFALPLLQRLVMKGQVSPNCARALAVQVEQAARRRHQHVQSLAQLVDLRLDRHAAIGDKRT